MPKKQQSYIAYVQYYLSIIFILDLSVRVRVCILYSLCMYMCHMS